MVNEYYTPGNGRAERVSDLFGNIARRYDLINDLQSFGLHRAWKRRVVRLAGISQGCRALDVCCGTGDIAFRLAGRGAEVIGLDFSAPMLRVASERARKGAAVPLFLRSDALRLPFPEACFDVVTVSYGLRNLDRWEAGLREMLRVIRPGGRVLVLDFGKPDNHVWRSLYFAYLRFCVPILGRIICGDAAAYGYILESLRHYPAQRGVAEKMLELGCQAVAVENLLGGVMSINHGVKAPGRGG